MNSAAASRSSDVFSSSLKDCIDELKRLDEQKNQQIKSWTDAQWAHIQKAQSDVKQLIEGKNVPLSANTDSVTITRVPDNLNYEEAVSHGVKEPLNKHLKTSAQEKEFPGTLSSQTDSLHIFEKAVKQQLQKLQLDEEKDAMEPKIQTTKNVTKRPFLRKGSGLQRFMPRPISYPKKPPAQKKEVLKVTVQKEIPADKVTEKPKHVSVVIPKESTSSLEAAIAQPIIVPNYTQDIHMKETKELAQFEILENFAHRTSFNSDSSFIEDVLRSGEPEKKVVEAATESSNRPDVQVPINQDDTSSTTDSSTLEAYINELHAHKKKLEEQFQQLDEKSIGVKYPGLSSKAPVFPSISLSSSEDELDAYIKNAPSCPLNIVTDKASDDTKLKRDERQVEIILQSDDGGSGDHRQQFESRINKETPAAAKMNDEAVGESPISASQMLLREKMAELEAEIHIYKTQNAVLEKLKKQREDELRKIQKDHDAFEKFQREEREKLNKEIAEKMSQIRREKQTFERYQKLRKDLPGRKERDELNALKQQIESLQEELKKQAIKSNTESKRLRRMLATAEKERDSLKLENKRLEEQRVELMEALKAKRKRQSVSDFKSTRPKSAEDKPIVEADENEDDGKDSEFVSEFSALKDNVMEKHMSLSDSDESEQRHHVRFNLAPEVQNFSPEGHTSNYKEIIHSDKIERIYNNGDREERFNSGTRKYISAGGLHIKHEYFNGDTEEIFPDGRNVYTYSDGIVATTFPDGVQVFKCPNQLIEERYPDGRKQITFPDSTKVMLYPDGIQETKAVDGKVAKIYPDGTVAVNFPSKDKEIRTSDYIRRVYANGIIKTVYKSGRQEKRFPNGRVKVKDKDGTVLIDTKYMNINENIMQTHHMLSSR